MHAASCMHTELLTADSTCISSTQSLHELFTYQHKLEAISPANDDRDM